MGLALELKFSFEDKTELEKFVDEVCEGFLFIKSENRWVIKRNEENPMTFEVSVTSSGLRLHCSGEYYYFLGYLLESATSAFGEVLLDDL